MRFSLDTNILIYSIRPEDRRSEPARRIMLQAVTADCVLTNQVLGEFFNVVRKKGLLHLDEARRTTADWALLFSFVPTSTEHLIAASTLAEQHRLQFWDSVILSVCGANQAGHLISEDMQDGATFGGVRLVNPFNPANAELLDLLLTPLPETA